MRRSVPLVIALALVAPALAACEKGPAPEGVATGRVTPASPSSRVTETPDATPAATDERVLEDGIVMARRSGLSFQAPEGWQAVDPGMAMSAGADAVPEFFEKLAESSGVSAAELAEQIGAAAEVFVMGPPSRGFAANITVVPSALLYLPEPDQLRAEMETVGATGVRVADRDTPIGPARVVSATLKVGPLTVASRPIVVEHDGHVTTITVSTNDPARSDALVADVIASLASL